MWSFGYADKLTEMDKKLLFTIKNFNQKLATVHKTMIQLQEVVDIQREQLNSLQKAQVKFNKLNITNDFRLLFEALDLMTKTQLKSASTKMDSVSPSEFNLLTPKQLGVLSTLRTLKRKALQDEDFTFEFLFQDRHKLSVDSLGFLTTYQDEVQVQWLDFVDCDF